MVDLSTFWAFYKYSILHKKGALYTEKSLSKSVPAAGFYSDFEISTSPNYYFTSNYLP
jgi:hypothetical protein